jgi:elongation factor 2
MLCDFSNCELKMSEPRVSYRETVIDESPTPCLAKSANRHNRLFMTAEPLSEEVVDAIEKGDIVAGDDIKKLSKSLVDLGWNPNDSKKIFCFGPEQTGPNIFVDQSIGVQNINEIKDSLDASFQWVTQEGPLMEENMRGVRWNLNDAKLIADTIHRGGGQIIPASKRALYGSYLTASPRLEEPIYLVDISTPQETIGAIYNCLSMRRGMVFDQEYIEGSPLVSVKGYLPVGESFGFAKELRAETSGKAFPQCSFDHWEIMKWDPAEEDSITNKIVKKVRTLRGLKPDLPKADSFCDKL